MESTAIPAGIQWRKSSYSSDQGGDCVEVAVTPLCIAVRDSKIPTESIVTARPATFAAFLNWAATARPELP
ncbi:DUF397 domain-containing protein [Streptomyces capillispiralis]|uniref:Uncharacterized protein DUF397 n=1 Tax=Streptomyces capillispiralis TaxID=68182 RepID=A0A561TKV2_9ACTN|nr:DUF397 domain-containing protein [Streptomyces capillispiralis]TWF87748.1 uncharacterized protein DUF397 [Streptomyces capillispiralis]GHH93887.1 hypothetical protein GCM10017779_43440 [Streptomyces capillispiralis]